MGEQINKDARISKLAATLSITLLLSAGCSTMRTSAVPAQSSVICEESNSKQIIAAVCVDGATKCVGGGDRGQIASGIGRTFVCKQGQWLESAGCGSCIAH